MKYIILGLLLSTQAHAFRLITNTGAAFSDDPVKIYVTSNSTCTNAGVSNNELLRMAKDAVTNFWNKVPTSSLRLKAQGILQTSDPLFLTGELCAPQDGVSCDPATTVPVGNNIIIACNSNATNFPSSSYLALTAPTNVSGSKIKGAVLLINDTASTAFAGLSYNEKRSVLAHEIGHAVGLGHSDKNYALMYYENSDKLFRLSQDDIDGVTYLYPNSVIDSCNGMFGGTIKFDDFDDNHYKTYLGNLLLGLSIGFLSLIIAKFFTIFGFLMDFRPGLK